MSKYLVINFNRYDTDCSTYKHVEADSPLDALVKSVTDEICESSAHLARQVVESYLAEEIIHTDEIFSSVAGEENDYLIYLI